MIQLDLKQIFGNGSKEQEKHNSSSVLPMQSNDIEDEIETNGAGSISGNNKNQVHGSSEEDNGEDEL